MFQAEAKKRQKLRDKKKGSPRGLPLQIVANRRLVLGLDSPAVCHFAFVHAQTETAIRIRTYPRLEQHRSAFLPVVRQGNQRASVTLLALRPLHHPRLLAADPNRIVRDEIIRPPNLKQRAATGRRGRIYFRARTEKPRSLLHSSERLPSSTVSSTTSRPHSRCR
jgi:hypothetical protein